VDGLALLVREGWFAGGGRLGGLVVGDGIVVIILFFADLKIVRVEIGTWVGQIWVDLVRHWARGGIGGRVVL
jgi:hypothetical protein